MDVNEYFYVSLLKNNNLNRPMNKTVLVIETPDMATETLRTLLESSGVTVVFATNLNAANDLILENRWGVITFCGRLANSHVFDTGDLIKLAKDKCPNTKLVAVSATHCREMTALGCHVECFEKIKIAQVIVAALE
jgi:CheY-like chemotaxis protein